MGEIQKFRFPPRGGFYYSNDLYLSTAYMSLSISERNLLHCFLNELCYGYFKKGGRKEEKHHTNNGGISFTMVQFKTIFKCTSQTYLKARNKLIKVGLITQTYRGGLGRGDMSRYKILCIPELPENQKRWKQYPEKNWARDIPKAKNSLVGKQTRFKKGESGRNRKKNLKPSLSNHTLNDHKAPNRVYPYEN